MASVLDKHASGPHDPIHSYATSPQMPLQAADKMRLRAQPYVSQVKIEALVVLYHNAFRVVNLIRLSTQIKSRTEKMVYVVIFLCTCYVTYIYIDLTNFLAQIRKIGMDILFPQNIHDKVLICIFVALQKNKCLAHRELIDLVILVNSQTHYGSTDTVTKVLT